MAGVVERTPLTQSNLTGIAGSPPAEEYARPRPAALQTLGSRNRRSVTTSFNTCRMTATVDASYLHFRSFIVAAPIVAAS
jgi:hypothetical protein